MTVIQHPFSLLFQPQFQQCFLVTEITIRDTLGGKQRSHISNPAVSHPVQIIGQFIGAVITVGNNRVTGFPSVIIIQIDHRDPGFCIQMLQVSIHHLTDNDNAIHLAFLYQLRHSAALFLHRSNDFQHGKTFLCRGSGSYRLVHLPVKRFIFIKESLRDQNTDIVALLVLTFSCR